MAPKRIKAKVPTSVAEDGENKPRKRGGKVLVDVKEISNVPELSDAVTTENGSGGDTEVVSKAVAKRGRKGAKEPVKEISNGVEVEVEEVAAEPAKEDAKVSKGAKRGGKKEKPVPKPAPLKDKEKEGSDPENEEIVEALAEKAPSKAVGRKRGKPADVDSSEKPEISETETKITAKNKKTTNKVAEAAPPTKGKKENKRGRKEDLGGEVEKKQSSRKREAKSSDDAKDAKKPKVTKTLQNKTATDFEEIDFSSRKDSPSGKLSNFKIASWNVDGIRSWVNKGGNEFINYEKPDIMCLQETRCPLDKLPDDVATIPGYHLYWLNSDKDGYAGVGIYTKQMAINVQYGIGDEDLDSESRIITAEYERFFLICTYVPNSGRGLVTLPKRLKWNELFKSFVKKLDEKKPVIICGDMNVSHLDIDLANPKTNKKNAGFTQEERDGMTALLSEGFVDTFRHLYPEKTGAYTFWTYMMNCRAKNVGWRLDYFIVSERLLSSVCDNVIRNQVYGSDHCPLTLFLHLNGVTKPEYDIEGECIIRPTDIFPCCLKGD